MKLTGGASCLLTHRKSESPAPVSSEAAFQSRRRPLGLENILESSQEPQREEGPAPGFQRISMIGRAPVRKKHAGVWEWDL
ncbi:hypothetical protein Celaphus_00001215 [Cervus elaphus hippelaphus]|uniref:Uncharacterized protein n=1 Tax=Cervus elaphus hippelaphus TaxID=46360 RepID=A0A212D6S9_CEREH|nr:hypothetical protein Celaphus_00001215 [Cervus elaphus hippelaphus]